MLYLNPLPDNKILGLPIMKAFADEKSNVTQNIRVVFHRIENIVGKEENAGYSIFFFSHDVFKRLFPLVHQKSSSCDNGLTVILSNFNWLTLSQTLNFWTGQN